MRRSGGGDSLGMSRRKLWAGSSSGGYGTAV